jgi:hypothetical protein
MSVYKSEMMGKANVLLRFAQGLQIAMEEGWDDEETMLTPAHVKDLQHKLVETRRIINRMLTGDFKMFEAVAEARKQSAGV